MRNLKKFLALALAMVMAFSLMLTANATTTGPQFDDNKDVTAEFEEAVDVLVGMEVFQGDEEAPTFRPADTITRAEVAALIYRLATGDVSDSRAGTYANYGNFADVAETDWFAGYVGYCANAGYIKGHDGYFSPYGQVTGYEALAMILRAVGYDKNHEFEGAAWETNVSALATQLGILTNIKTTHYGNTLYLASRRDVVAELLFQAVSKPPMVVYTPAFGYQPYGMTTGNSGTGSLIGGGTAQTTNPTLGKHVFGLTNEERIVVGNQETGEKCTVMGATADGTWTYRDAGNNEQVGTYTMYAYPGGLAKLTTENPNTAANLVYPESIGLKLDVKTGLELFGHKLDVWYSSTTKVDGAQKTYAYYDKATSALVDGSSDTGAAKNATTVVGLDRIAPDGLTVGTSAHISESFARITDRTYTTFVDNTAKISTNTANSPQDLYLLIDNTDDGNVDVVIPLNVQTSKITAVDNVNAVKTVQAPMATTVPAFDADTTTVWTGLSGTEALIEQDALVGDSAKTLNDYEIGFRVNGTRYDDTIANTQIDQANAGGNSGDLTYGYKHDHTFTNGHTENALFRLAKLDTTKRGQVASFNDAQGIVVLADGTRLERSPFYHTVVGNNFYTNAATAATSVSADFQSWQRIDAAGNYKEGYTNGTYDFYLDRDGKYVGAVRVQDLGFIYGTYMDYDQVTSSSSFNYYVTGVDMNGDIVKQQQVTRFNGTAVTGTDEIGIPFRDTFGGNGNPGTPVVMNGIGAGQYKGMTVNGTTLRDDTASLGVIGVTQGSTGTGTYFDNITIRSGDVNLGAKAARPSTTTLPGGDVGATSTATDSTTLYFTNNTKFILVSGYGTDSVKAEVFEGINGLLGESNAVSINFNFANSVVGIPHITDGTGGTTDVTMEMMSFFTMSDFVYAQTLGTLSQQVDTIILPAAAVVRSSSSNLYYVGNPNATLWNGNVTGQKASQFTMYRDGEAENIWIQGLSYEAAGANNSAATVAANSDTFWQLRDTGLKTNTGEPIYQAGEYTGNVFTVGATNANAFAHPSTGSDNAYTARPGNNGMAHVTYNATTYDAQVAMICGALKNVANVKVVNLNAKDSPTITAGSAGATSGYVWPGIDNTLANLNNAGSVAGSGAYINQNLYVSVVYSNGVDYNGTNSNIAAVVYVCWDQNPS